MSINPEQLARQLERGLAPVYLVSGDEPLLVDECSEAIRARARAEGYGEREIMTVESGFDWGSLTVSSQSLSLFAERRLLELRLPTGRPGEAGAEALAALAQTPSPDLVLLVIAGKLDKTQRDSSWVRAIEAAGTHVQIKPLDAGRLPAWISQRLAARGLKPEPGVVDLLAWNLEGNLLAAAQEVAKLAMLCGQGVVRRADVEDSLADSSRFNVFGLVDACLQGEIPSARRMLLSLRADGTEPILVLWALARELRTLAALAQEVARGKSESAALARVWQNRRAVVAKALRRHRLPAWLGFVRRAARLDRILKGRVAGDTWLELERLLLTVAGLQAFAAPREEMEAST
jgi:DNA polymerase-3 subunit delta